MQSAVGSDLDAPSMRREPSFSTVQVALDFSPQDCADTFAALPADGLSAALESLSELALRAARLIVARRGEVHGVRPADRSTCGTLHIALEGHIETLPADQFCHFHRRTLQYEEEPMMNTDPHHVQ